MNYYILAGEASGDLHASNLIKELKKIDENASFRCWGGDLMQNQGATIVKHIRDLAFMGFVEVLANIKTILGNFKVCKADILNHKPDVLILVDYPGFNLRMAEWAKKNGILVYYYISPQIWAWKKNRIKKIRRFVDKMFCIIPFEKQFYADHGLNVEYVGHPLLDAIKEYRENQIKPLKIERPFIAILPGSRKQEIKRMLPVMLESAAKYPEFEIVVAAAPALSLDFYQPFIGNHKVHLIQNQTYDIFSQCHAALVKSGTSTLEAALFKVPQVVCYKAAEISYQIAKSIVTIKYVSLANLIQDRLVVKELLQHDFTVEKISGELAKLLYDDQYRKTMMNDFELLAAELGEGGASKKAAELMFQHLTKR